MKASRSLMLVIGMAVLTGGGFAGEPAGAEQQPAVYTPGRLSVEQMVGKKNAATVAGPGWSQIAGYLFGLTAMAAGGIYIMRRGLPFGRSKSTENRLHVLETKMLGNRQFLVVVEYEDSRMLLGVSPGKIEHLSALDSPCPELERMKAHAARAEAWTGE